jgi:hypothetical protein
VIKGEMRMNNPTVKERLQKVSATSRIAEAWVSYAKTNGLRPGTQKYELAQHSFVNGCNTMSPDGLPPIVQMYVMCGRDIADIAKIAREQEAVTNENDSQVA